MIGSLRGTVLDRRPRHGGGYEVLVEVGGVGYRTIVPGSPVSDTAGGGAGPVGSPVFLHVHTHVREDAIVLYGFATREERACFEALISAHGVGPAVALAILSVHTPLALRRAVQADDSAALTLVPGIGPKTAARLIIELKSRLDLAFDDPGLHLVSTSPEGGSGRSDVRSDVRTALASLGYGADEIRQAMSHLPDEGTAEDQLRVALQGLAAAR